MKRVVSFGTVLVAGAAALFCGTANPQGRASAAPKSRGGTEQQRATNTRTTKLAELDEWLGRLVGRFRYEGNLKAFFGTTGKGLESAVNGCEAGVCFVYSNARGDGSCAGIGESSGVTCTIAVPWPRLLPPSWVTRVTSSEINWPGPFLDNAKALYGVDPENLGIRFLLVDGQSIAVEALGFLQGDTATFSTACLGKASDPRCKRIFTIRAWPGGKRIQMQFEVKSAGGVQAGYTFNLSRL